MASLLRQHLMAPKAHVPTPSITTLRTEPAIATASLPTETVDGQYYIQDRRGAEPSQAETRRDKTGKQRNIIIQGDSVGIGGRDWGLLFMHVYLRFVMYTTTLPSCDSPVVAMGSMFWRC